MFDNFGFIGGMKIIVDKNCYKEKTVVRGLADKRRPNNKKMLYRKVRIKIPIAFLIKSTNTLVCAPEYYEKMKQEIKKQEQEMRDEVKQITTRIERDIFMGRTDFGYLRTDIA